MTIIFNAEERLLFRKFITFGLLFVATGASTAHAITSSFRRASLVKMAVTGYAPLAPKRTFLDIGISEKREGKELVGCEILQPKKTTKVATKPWAPFDFYTNVAEAELATVKAEQQGEPNVFFDGDDNNRNGAAQSHKFTLFPLPSFSSSMEFLERRIAANKEWFTFFVKFTRGPIKFESLIRVIARQTDDEPQGSCVTAVQLCDKTSAQPDGTHSCDGGWTKQFHSVSAAAKTDQSYSEILLNLGRAEKDKTDIRKLIGQVQKIDRFGNPLGEPYEEVLAEQ